MPKAAITSGFFCYFIFVFSINIALLFILLILLKSVPDEEPVEAATLESLLFISGNQEAFVYIAGSS